MSSFVTRSYLYTYIRGVDYKGLNESVTSVIYHMTQKLEAKRVSTGLAVDLAEVRRNLQAESDELGILSTALGVVCDDLEVVQSEGTSSLMAHAVQITMRVRQLMRKALHIRVNQSFTIAHSQYGDSIDLEMMMPWLRAWL